MPVLSVANGDDTTIDHQRHSFRGDSNAVQRALQLLGISKVLVSAECFRHLFVVVVAAAPFSLICVRVCLRQLISVFFSCLSLSFFSLFMTEIALDLCVELQGYQTSAH